MGTDENLFRLVPVPGHGAQISARTSTKGYVQTGARRKETGNEAQVVLSEIQNEAALA